MSTIFTFRVDTFVEASVSFVVWDAAEGGNSFGLRLHLLDKDLRIRATYRIGNDGISCYDEEIYNKIGGILDNLRESEGEEGATDYMKVDLWKDWRNEFPVTLEDLKLDRGAAVRIYEDASWFESPELIRDHLKEDSYPGALLLISSKELEDYQNNADSDWRSILIKIRRNFGANQKKLLFASDLVKEMEAYQEEFRFELDSEIACYDFDDLEYDDYECGSPEVDKPYMYHLEVDFGEKGALEVHSRFIRDLRCNCVIVDATNYSEEEREKIAAFVETCNRRKL